MRYVGAWYTKILTDAQGMSLTARQIFEINCSTQLYGLLLPGELMGGAVRWYKLSSPDRKPVEGLVVIVFGRVVDTILLIFTGLAFWAIGSPLDTRGGNLTLLVLTVLGLLALLYALIFDRRVSNLWLNVARSSLLPQAIRTKVEKAHFAARGFRDIPTRYLIRYLLLNLLRHAIGVLSLFALALAVQLPLTLVNVGAIRSVMLLVTMLPISISGIGVREASLIFLTEGYGVLPTDAVAWSILIFCGTLVVAGIGGVIEARDAWFRRRHSTREAP